MRIIVLALLFPILVLGSRSFTATSNTLLAAVGSALPATGAVSVAFSPNYLQNDGALHYIYETDVTGGYFRIIHATDNSLQFNIVNASGNWSAFITTYTMPINTWTVITANWTNGGLMKICFNGVFCANTSIGGNLIWTTSNTTWSVGNNTSGGSDNRGLSGLVGVWNRILTQDEIVALSLFYRPGVVALSGLLHEWDLVGSSLSDSVGSVTLTNSGPTAGADQPPLFGLGSPGGLAKYAIAY